MGGESQKRVKEAKVLSIRYPTDSSFSDLYLLADQCLDLQDIVLSNLQQRFRKGEQLDRTRIIATFNLYKATDALISCMKLIDSGLVGDAQTILRKILEIAINLKFIWLDKPKRVDQYWHYMTVKADKLAKNISTMNGYTASLKEGMAKLAPGLAKNLELAKNHFDLKESGKISGKYNSSWSGHHIGVMAEDCGLLDDYRYCYKVSSISTHASIEDIRNYFDPDIPAFGPRYSKSLPMKIILESIRCYLMVLEVTVEEYHLNLNDSIASIRRSVGTYKNDPRLKLD